MRYALQIPPLLIIAGASCAPSARAATLENLALNRPFTCTSPNEAGWDGLVDGVRDQDRAPGCFATGGDDRFPKFVIIDLGSAYQVSRVDVSNSLNGNTKTVEIYGGLDGRKFTMLRAYVFPNRRLQTLTHKFPPRPIRFVKIAFRDTYGGGFGGDNYMYLREMEVWGEPHSDEGAQPRDVVELAPRVSPRWLRVFRRYALGGSAPLKMIALGDCALLPPDEQPEVRAFSVLLARKLDERYGRGDQMKVEVTNIAAQDLTSTASLERLDEDVIALDPDMVLICLGVADSLEWDPAGFRLALNRLVARLKERTDAAIILIAPPPISDDPNVPHNREASGRSSDAAARIVRAVAVLNGIPLVDTPKLFADSDRSDAELYADTLHLTVIGHELIAGALFDTLQE